jgi:hypothetical protein
MVVKCEGRRELAPGGRHQPVSNFKAGMLASKAKMRVIAAEEKPEWWWKEYTEARKLIEWHACGF